MKTFILLSLLAKGMAIFSQNIGVYAGINSYHFHDKPTNYKHRYESIYNSGQSFSAGVIIEDITVSWFKLGFALGYEDYGGSFKVTSSTGFWSTTTTTEAEINKGLLSIGFYPVNIKIKKKLRLSLGYEYSQLIHEKNTGTEVIASYITSSRTEYETHKLDEKYDRYNSQNYHAIRMLVAYDFNLSGLIQLSPQYSYCYGFSREFDEHPLDVGSTRHFLGIVGKLRLAKKGNE